MERGEGSAGGGIGPVGVDRDQRRVGEAQRAGGVGEAGGEPARVGGGDGEWPVGGRSGRRVVAQRGEAVAEGVEQPGGAARIGEAGLQGGGRRIGGAAPAHEHGGLGERGEGVGAGGAVRRVERGAHAVAPGVGALDDPERAVGERRGVGRGVEVGVGAGGVGPARVDRLAAVAVAGADRGLAAFELTGAGGEGEREGEGEGRGEAVHARIVPRRRASLPPHARREVVGASRPGARPGARPASSDPARHPARRRRAPTPPRPTHPTRRVPASSDPARDRVACAHADL
ncbi:MAG: hypothetical protein H6701_02650 [Myxococcales bacterium]|nr:hypothetical protein [Myxococcales bacterium]